MEEEAFLSQQFDVLSKVKSFRSLNLESLIGVLTVFVFPRSQPPPSQGQNIVADMAWIYRRLSVLSINPWLTFSASQEVLLDGEARIDIYQLNGTTQQMMKSVAVPTFNSFFEVMVQASDMAAERYRQTQEYKDIESQLNLRRTQMDPALENVDKEQKKLEQERQDHADAVERYAVKLQKLDSETVCQQAKLRSVVEQREQLEELVKSLVGNLEPLKEELDKVKETVESFKAPMNLFIEEMQKLEEPTKLTEILESLKGSVALPKEISQASEDYQSRERLPKMGPNDIPYRLRRFLASQHIVPESFRAAMDELREKRQKGDASVMSTWNGAKFLANEMGDKERVWIYQEALTMFKTSHVYLAIGRKDQI